MAVYFKNLWIPLIDKDIKKDLIAIVGLSPATIIKMGKGGPEVLLKIFFMPSYSVEGIIEIILK